MIRLVLVWLLSFVVAAGGMVPGHARASAPEAPADPVDTAFEATGYTLGAFKEYFGVLEEQRWDAAADVFVDHQKTIGDLTEAIEFAEHAEGWKTIFNWAGHALNGIEFAWHAVQGEWLEATKTAAGAIADYASGLLMQAAIGEFAVVVCGVLIVGTVGLATPVCIAAVVVAAHVIRSYAVTEATKGLVGWAGQHLTCRYRPRTNRCDLVPGDPPGGLVWRPTAPEDVWEADGPPLDALTAQRSGQGAEAGIGGRIPRPGGGMGSSRITASAEDVTTIATGGATAVTEIGVGNGGGGRLVVEAQDVVTTATGRDARTTIGSGSGVVSVQGGVINQGGTLEIGASGTSRDGKTCIEIYRQTCIVHYYFRRKHDPCLPGYWIDGRKCRLPADTRHKIK